MVMSAYVLGQGTDMAGLTVIVHEEAEYGKRWLGAALQLSLDDLAIWAETSIIYGCEAPKATSKTLEPPSRGHLSGWTLAAGPDITHTAWWRKFYS
jgi:hypothetical protein